MLEVMSNFEPVNQGISQVFVLKCEVLYMTNSFTPPPVSWQLPSGHLLISSALEYAAFCQLYAAELPIFLQPWWLDAVGQQGHWQKYVIKDNSDKPIGIWPVFTKRRYGFYWHTLPPYTPVSGPWFAEENTLTQPLLEALVSQISKSSLYWLLQSVRYIQQAAWWQKNGFEVEIWHTYQLPATDDAMELFKKFRSTTRNEIKKASPFIEIRQETDLQHFMPLYTQHAQAKKIFDPAAATAFQAVFAVCTARAQGQLLCAYDQQENLLAGIFCVWDQKTTYLLVISRQEQTQPFSPTRFLLWQAIKLSATQGRIFDFEGGRMPSIGDFFASFGATKTAYLRAILYPNPLVRFAVRLTKYVRHPQSRFFR